MFLNEDDIDAAVVRWCNHPVLRRATRVLSEYRHEVNRKSDGWAYWGHKAAQKLMNIIHDAHPWLRDPREPTDEEITQAIAPIRAFCTKKGLTFPTVTA